MLSSASYQGPFLQPDLPDTEGAQTRWNMQPTVLLVLLSEPPRTQGYETLISPRQGKPQTVISGRFNYDLAKILHENAVRIPAYLVRSASVKQPGWLREHMSDAVIAICPADSIKLDVIGDEDLTHQLFYHPEQGISYEKISGRPAVYQDADEFDSWF